MTPPAGVLDAERPLDEALAELGRAGVRVAPVVSSGDRFVGLLVKGDTPRGGTAGEACRRGVCIRADDPLSAALEALQDARVGRIPVVDGEALVGEISSGAIRLYRARRLAGDRSGERSKIRWQESRPGKALTWGIELSGKAFVAKAESYGAFGPGKAILEIGPGYGRLFSEVINMERPFRAYVGVDISATNAAHLTRLFDRPDFKVVHADVETVTLDERFDAVLSSLTLKHMYPSFEAALRNVVRHLNPGATVIFDLIEGEAAPYSPDVDFLRAYPREEVEAILARVQLERVAFDEVEHAPGYARLLVVARRPA
jgi:CBS domain-containing protein/2-polyprenyl-3-methyl-5-hydroxy-6-metoxy-1,4-benzoquinol methylase